MSISDTIAKATVFDEQGREDILIVVGGVVPPGDHEALKEAGAAAIFGPGTVITEAAGELLAELGRSLDHDASE